MNRYIILLGRIIIGIALLFSVQLYAQNTSHVIYVNPESRGEITGQSWTQAYRNLPDALIEADSIVTHLPNNTIEIWVTAGIFEPHDTVTSTAFYMRRNVNVFGGFIGYETAKEQRNLENHPTYLVGNGHRILYGDIAKTDSAVWDGFTFTNAGSGGMDGSGAYLRGNAMLRNCTFINNRGNNVIYIDNTNLNLTDPITNLSYCSVSTDSCVAVSSKDYTHIDHCMITIIQADYAVKVEGSHTILSYCTIRNNLGTGVYINQATLTLSYILNNWGNGIYCDAGNVTGCVIANNGLYGIVANSTNGVVNIVNNTIVNNGGISNESGGVSIFLNGDNVNMYNNVLWGNNNSNGRNEYVKSNVNGALVLRRNAIRGGSIGTSLPIENTINLEDANRGVENNKNYPFFVSPTIGTGPEFSDGLWNCEVLSALINTGIAETPSGITVPITDLDGNLAIWQRDSGGVVDIGAYEYQRAITVHPQEKIVYVSEGGKGKKDGTSWDNAIEDLFDAVAIAYRDGAHSVWVAKGTYYGDSIKTNPAFFMFRGVNVYGGFAGNESAGYDINRRNCKENVSILDGQHVQRVLYQIADFDTVTTWDGFTIQNGYTYYAGNLNTTPEYGNGAGVFLRRNGHLVNCIVTNNTAEVLEGGGSVGIGSGIYADNHAIVSRCAINYNYTDNRTAGVYLDNYSKIFSSLISNNQSIGLIGAGLYLGNNTVAENITVVNNASTSFDQPEGSAVFIGSSTAKMKNSIVWGNYNERQIENYDVFEDADITYTAIMGGYQGNGNNIDLESQNDGDNESLFYPRFVLAVNSQGVMTSNNSEFNTANWSLKRHSSCKNVGTRVLENTDTLDLAGNNRLSEVYYDLGAYEQAPISMLRGSIVYVTPDGTGNGTSWKYASGDLNLVVSSVSEFNKLYATTPEERVSVWVKHGIYYGDAIACHPAFYIEPMVDVYGDLAGNESADYNLNLRNFVDEHITVLDGQKKQRVLLQNGYYENGTVGFNNLEQSLWDGFTIRNGRTRCDAETPNHVTDNYGNNIQQSYRNRGAGVFLQKNAFLSNCRILDNYTTMQVPDTSFLLAVQLYEGWGAGVFMNGQSILYNCIINGNSSASRCGGVYLDWNSTLLNCVVTNNESFGVGSCDNSTDAYTYGSERGGAGVYAYHSSIYNTTIANNKLKRYQNKSLPNGAGVYLNATTGNTLIANSIVWGNVTADNDGTESFSQLHCHVVRPNISVLNNAVQQVFVPVANGPIIRNNLVLDSLNNGNAVNKYYPKFIYPNDIRGTSTNGVVYSQSNWSLRGSSDCINIGNNANYNALLENYPFDIVGNSRIFHDTIDLGAYEYTYLHSEDTVVSNNLYVTQTGSGDGTSWLTAFGDLQVAIDSANARRVDANQSINIWIAAGEYYGDLVSENNGIELKEGVNLYGGFNGTETSLDQRDYINNKTILSGRNQQRVILQASDFEKLTILSGFYITEGNSHGQNGGGVFLRGNGMIDNCIIENNNAGTGLGGGVYATDGAIINVSSIKNNTASNGSAAYLTDSVFLIGANITANTVTDENGFTVVVDNKVTIDSCYVFDNNGGGVHAMNESSVVLSKIVGNSGCGVSADTNVNLINLLIANNDGGGVKATHHSKIYNNTVVNNYIATDSLQAAGLDIDSCEVINTIVWNNKKGNVKDQIRIRNHSIMNNNAIQDTLIIVSGSAISTASNNKKLSSSNYGANNENIGYAFFIKPINTVGANASDRHEANWGLLPGSICYDNGFGGIINQLPSVDLFGQPRKSFVQIDIGAYETQWSNSYVYNKVFVVEGGRGNLTGVSWDNAMPSIQGAVAIAEVLDIDVWVAKGDYYGEAEDDNAFMVGDSVRVYGALLGTEEFYYDLDSRDFYNDLSVLHGNHHHRVLCQGAASKGASLWSGFLISDGKADSNNLNGNGGGIYLRNNVTLDHVYVLDCMAEGNGGGIYSEGNTTIISGGVRNCEAAHSGGAIYADSMNIINNIIINNKAADNGGGLFLSKRSVVINNTITYNTINSGFGGGMYANTGAQTYILNNVLWQNKKNNSYDQIAFNDWADAIHCSYNAIQDLSDSLTLTPNHNNINLAEDNIGSDTAHNNHVCFIFPTTIQERENWSVLSPSALIDAGKSYSNYVQYGDNPNEYIILPSYDLNGNRRIDSVQVDIGAFESHNHSVSYKVVYVVPGDGIGTKTGHDWNNALGSVNTAAALASVVTIDNVPGNDHPPVWIAEGLYIGDTAHNDFCFKMYNDAQVYGSFRGSEVPDFSKSGFYDMSLLPSGTSILDGQNSSRVLIQPVDFDSVTAWHNFVIQNGYSDEGAGAYLRKNGMLENCYVMNNTATGKGGGVYAAASSIVQHSTLTDNHAGVDGGAIYADGALVVRSRVENNSAAGNGGGVFADSSIMLNTVILDNDSSGGVYAVNRTRLINNTITGNNIISRPALISTGSGVICDSSVDILNSIIWGNTRGNGIDKYDDQFSSNCNHIAYSAILGDTAIEGVNGNINLTLQNLKGVNDPDSLHYPAFVNPIANHRPTVSSSFINIAHPQTDSIINTLNLPAVVNFYLDIDGNPRKISDNIDMGAAELQSIVYTCYDTLCSAYEYNVTCHGRDFVLISNDLLTSNGNWWEEPEFLSTTTLFSVDTLGDYYNIYITTIDVPAPPIVTDVHVCDYNELDTLINYVHSDEDVIISWKVNGSGVDTFSMITPPRPITETSYTVYASYSHENSCSSDTASFTVNKDLVLNVYPDSIYLCKGTIDSVRFDFEYEAVWTSSDSSVVMIDSVGLFDTILPIHALSVGVSTLHYRKSTCGHDSVVVFVHDIPQILPVSPDRDSIVSLINTAQYLSTAVDPGTWMVNNQLKADITPDGILQPSDTGVVVISFVENVTHCSANKTVTIIPCNCSLTLSNQTDIINFRDAVNLQGTFQGHSGENGFAGCTISITTHIGYITDILNNAVPWTPIGTTAHPFKGKMINSSQRVLQRILVNEGDTVGLFGCAVGATFTHMRLTGDKIPSGTTPWSTIKGGNIVGGLVGYARNCNFTYCSTGPIVIGDNYVGGMVGLAESCRFVECLNIATVTANNNYGGGLVGKAINTTFDRCENAGWLKSPNDNAILGGIVGETNDTIKNSLQLNCVGTPPHAGTYPNMGSILGNALPGAIITRSFYDKQLSPLPISGSDVVSDNSSGELTQDMIGERLNPRLEPTSGPYENQWTYDLNSPYVYPQNKVYGTLALTASKVAVSLVSIPNNETVDNVSSYDKVYYDQAYTTCYQCYTPQCQDSLVIVQYVRSYSGDKFGDFCGVKMVPLYIKVTADIALNSDGDTKLINDTGRVCKGVAVTLNAVPINATSFSWSYRAPDDRPTNTPFYGASSTQTDYISSGANGFQGNNEGWYFVTTTINNNCTTRDSIYIKESFCEDTLHLCTFNADTIDFAYQLDSWTSNDTSIATFNRNVVVTHNSGTTTLYHCRGTSDEDSLILIVYDLPRITVNDTTVSISDLTQFDISPQTPGQWMVSNPNMAAFDQNGNLAPNDIGTVKIWFNSDFGCVSDTVNVHIIRSAEVCSFTISSNIDSLRRFSEAVNNGGIVYDIEGEPHNAFNGFAGCKIFLQGDQYEVIQNWNPIGTLDRPFKGEFDAQNHTINGIIVSPNANLDFAGFFGVINYADIKNLHIGNAGDTCLIFGSKNAGGIVGYAQNSHIYNCSTAPFVSGKQNVGGAVGYAENSIVEKITNIATVTADSDSSFAGGVVGNAYNTKIFNCLNAGWVKRNDDNAYLGGIVGKTDDSVRYCLNVGVIATPPRTNKTKLGNICGYAKFPAVLSKNAYDTLMNTFAVVASYVDNGSVLDSNSNYNSNQLLNDSIQFLLKSEWTYRTDNLYPYPNNFLSSIVKIAISPLYVLQAGETVDNICAGRGAHVFDPDGLEWTNTTPLLHCWNTDSPWIVGVEISNDSLDGKKEIPLYIHNSSAAISYQSSNNGCTLSGNTLNVPELADLSLIAFPDHQTEYKWTFRAPQEVDVPFFNSNNDTCKTISTNRFISLNEGWYILHNTMPNCSSVDSIFINIIPNENVIRLCAGSKDTIQNPGVGTFESMDTNVVTINNLNGEVTAKNVGTASIWFTSSGNVRTEFIYEVTAIAHITVGDTTVKLNTAPTFHVSPAIFGNWQVDNSYLTDIDPVNGRLFPNDTGKVRLTFISSGGCVSNTITVTIDTCNCLIGISHRSGAIQAFAKAVNTGGLYIYKKDCKINTNDPTPTFYGTGDTLSAENGFAGCYIRFAVSGCNPSANFWDWAPSLGNGNDSQLNATTASIGTSSHPFKGTFDGGFHMIARFYATDPNKDTVGFFGYIQNATIKNVSLGAKSKSKVIGNNYVGALVGYAKNSKIIDCSTGPYVEGHNHVGGMVGFADNTPIMNATTAATVTVKSNNGCGGGIVGSAVNSDISNSINAGWIKPGTGISATLGGIVGNSSDNISNCMNTGTVGTYPHNDPNQHWGAICGMANNVLIDSCYFDKQTCPIHTFVGNGNATTTHSDSLLTVDMLGNNLKNRLEPNSNTTWLFADTLYPRMLNAAMSTYSGNIVGKVAASPLVILSADETIDFASKYSVYNSDTLLLWDNIDTANYCHSDDIMQTVATYSSYYSKGFTPYREIPLFLYKSLADLSYDVSYVISATQDSLTVFEHDSITLKVTPSDGYNQWSYIGTGTPFYDIADIQNNYIHTTDCGLKVNNSGWYYIDLQYHNCTSRDSIYLTILPDEDSLEMCKGEELTIFSFMRNAQWRIGDPTVISISDSMLTALDFGATFIYYTFPNNCAYDSIYVTVCNAPNILEPDTSVFIRHITQFHLTNDIDGLWLSGDERIASVRALTGKFAPNDTGNVKLYFISDCGGCTDSITVHIYDTCDCVFNLPHRTAEIQAFRDAVNSGDVFFNKDVSSGGDSLMYSAENGFAGCTISFSPLPSAYGNNSYTNGVFKKWVPIGTSEHPFKGKFNGNYKTISSTSNHSDPSLDTLGFFGYIESAEIYNLVCSQGKKPVDSALVQYFGGDFVGVLVGYAKNSYIHHCVTAVNVTGTNHVGGAVGYAENSRIESVTNLSTVTVNGQNGSGGGIVGTADNTSIQNCHNVGWIRRVYDNTFIGGIAGTTNNSIAYSINCGVVGTPPHANTTLMGGIAGRALQSASIDTTIFDKQMSPFTQTVGSGTPTMNLCMARTTREITTNAIRLFDYFSDDKWDLSENNYPYVQINNTPIAALRPAIYSFFILRDEETVDHVSAFQLTDFGTDMSWSPTSCCTETDSLEVFDLYSYWFSNDYCTRRQVPVFLAPTVGYIEYETDDLQATYDPVNKSLNLGANAHLVLKAHSDTAISYQWSFRDGGISFPFFIPQQSTNKSVSTGNYLFSPTNTGWYFLDVNHFNCSSRDSIYVRVNQMDWLFNYDVSWFTQDQGNNPDDSTYNHIYAGYGTHTAGSSKEYPYLISDVYDLRGLAKIVNGGAKMTDSLCRWIDGVGSATQTSEDLAPLAISVHPSITQSDSCFNFAGKYIRMTQNIKLNDEVFSRNDTGALLINGVPYDHYLNHFYAQIKMWDPIGYYVHGSNKDRIFRGVFDGNNDTISGVYIFYDALNMPKHGYQGLFGYVADTIKNLTLSNSYFGSNNEGMMDIGNTPGGLGSIVCFMDACALLNCHTDTTVTINGVGAGRVGGLVANVSSSQSSNSIISKCTNGAEIFGRVHTNQSETNIGGIVGVSSGTISGTALPNGTCINNGNIHVTRIGGNNLNINVGGIAGKLSSTPYRESQLNSCVNNGNVIIGRNATQSSALNYYVGGVVGVCEGAKITGISNTGSVENASGFVGGICGVLKDFRSGNAYVQGDMSNIRIVGVRFSVADDGWGETSAYGCSVGLMRDKSQISHISVTDIEMDLDISTSADTVPGKTSVGMLVGEMRDSTYVNSVEIMDNNLTMQVTVDSSQIDLYVGAAVGYIADTGCIFNYGRTQGEFNITIDSADNSTFPINADIGGFVGKSNGRILNAASLNIFNYTGHCNNLNGKFGGLAGVNNGYIINCHSHNTLNLDSISIIDYVGGLIGLNDTNGVLSNVYSLESFRPAGHSRGTIYGGSVVGENRGLVEYTYRKPSQLHGISIPFVGNSTATATLRDTAYFVDYHGALTAPATYPYSLVLCDALNCWVTENTNLENEGTYYTWVVYGYQDSVYQGYPYGGAVAARSLNGGQVGYDQYILYDSIPNTIGNIRSGANWDIGTYQWQDSTRLHGWQDIAGANDSIYIPPTPNIDTTWYRRVFTSNCSKVSSNMVTIRRYNIPISNSGLTIYGDTTGHFDNVNSQPLVTHRGQIIDLPSIDRYGNVYNFTPFVITNTIDSVTTSSVEVFGTLYHRGTSAVTQLGIQISTTSDFSSGVTSSGNITPIGNEFKYRFTGLTDNTTYYVRAYATNSEGTGYGAIFILTTLDE